jgi:hypothetical protein
MDTNTQPTIWEVPDNVWTIIEPILNLAGLGAGCAGADG